MKGRTELQTFEQQGEELCVGHIAVRSSYCESCIADEFNKQCAYYKPMTLIKFGVKENEISKII